MAEALARAVARRRGVAVEADSAGTLDIEGRAPPANTLAVMDEIGLSLRDHRSKGLKREHLRWADHVLVMTLEHAAEAHGRDPEAGEKVKLLGPYGGKSPEIADPMGWWRPAHRTARREIEQALEGLLDRLADEALSPRS